MEGWLPEEPKKKYTLKNGGQVEGSSGIGTLRALESLLVQSPDLFNALLAIVQGRAQDATPEAITELRKATFIGARTGAVIPEIRDVLLSAYQETPEGPVLVNPYRFESEAEAREVERDYGQSLDWLARHLRRKDDKE